jgi:hypothetical protein
MEWRLGDRPWLAHYGHEQVQKICPICYGNLKVTLTLGNGDTCIIECSACGLGYDGPRGYINEYEYVSNVEQLTITRIDKAIDATGEISKYHFYDRYADESDRDSRRGHSRMR